MIDYEKIPKIPEVDVEKCAKVMVMAMLSHKAKELEMNFQNFFVGDQLCGNFKVVVSPRNDDNREWLIWSIEHAGWWKPLSKGYTQEREKAGRYTYKEALKIVSGANIGEHDVPNEAMIKYEIKK